MKVSFDQFYTNPLIAYKLYSTLSEHLRLSEYDLYVEPSAGSGAFYSLMPEENRIGFDLDPAISDIIKCDFLEYNIKSYVENKTPIFIGNPPFGRRSKLAIDFMNQCMKYGSVVAMVLPVSFMKYSAQSKINKNFGIIHEETLPHNSFIANGKPYNVNTVWQIWKIHSGMENRILGPIRKHPDFIMYQYNNTESAKKFFHYQWDFAVPRQGYQDYSRRETDQKKCERNKQWMFFSSHNKKVLDVLMSIDFYKLSAKNTSTPGFGKADVIEEYLKLSDEQQLDLSQYL